MELLKECHGTVDWMTLKLDRPIRIHDDKWCHSAKLVLISLDKSSSSQNEWNGRKLLMNWQE